MSDELIVNSFEDENESQISAITHPPGKNLVIVAGPGTGKTRVIIKRISYLIDNKVANAENILLVTFTNRAINEIISRIKSKSVLANNIFYAGTMHSIAKKLITKFKSQLHLINVKPMEKISLFDDENENSFLYKWTEINKKKYSLKKPAKELMKIIVGYIKNTKHYNYIRWNKNNPAKFDHRLYGDERGFTNLEFLADIFAEYRQHLIDEQKFDFEDLLIMLHQLLITESTGVREWCRTEFKHILVDEFQDINTLQLEILREISGNNHNICCVGDPNQAIYSFQGAHPRIFNDFKQMYPDHTREIYLNENYRSTKKIVNLSNKLISFNETDNEVNIYTAKNPAGNNVIFYLVSPRTHSGHWLVKKVKELQSSGVKLKDIAILYRSQFIVARLKTMFAESGINVVDYNCSTVIKDDETQIIICFLNLCFDNDSLSVKFLLDFYYQEERVSDKAINSVACLVEKHGGSWYDALFNVDEIQISSSQDKVFFTNLKDLITRLKKNFIDRKEMFMSFHGKDNLFITGAMQQIKKVFSSQTLMYRKFAIHNFYVSISNSWHASKHNHSIYEFVQHMMWYVKYFQSVQDEFCLNCSTIHSSKGCEFDHVILVGVTEKMLPSSYVIDDIEDENKVIKSNLDEERRVMYVAVTRAKKTLYLIHSQLGRNQKMINSESRFITELKSDKEIDYLEEVVIDGCMSGDVDEVESEDESS